MAHIQVIVAWLTSILTKEALRAKTTNGCQFMSKPIEPELKRR